MVIYSVINDDLLNTLVFFRDRVQQYCRQFLKYRSVYAYDTHINSQNSVRSDLVD